MKSEQHQQREECESPSSGMAIWNDWERRESHRSPGGDPIAAKVEALPPSSGLSIERAPGGEALSLVYRPPLMRVLQKRVTRRALEQGGWLFVMVIVGFGILQLISGMAIDGDASLMFAAMALGFFLPPVGGAISALHHLLKWSAPRHVEIKGDTFFFKTGRTRWGGVRALRAELGVRVEERAGRVVLSDGKQHVELFPLTPVEVRVLRHHLIDGMGMETLQESLEVA